MRISEKLQGSLKAYLEEGVLPGSFLRSVLQNNLMGAIQNADQESMQQLPALVNYLHYEVPANAWGSEQKVKDYAQEVKKAPEMEQHTTAENAFAQYDFEE